MAPLAALLAAGAQAAQPTPPAPAPAAPAAAAPTAAATPAVTPPAAIPVLPPPTPATPARGPAPFVRMQPLRAAPPAAPHATLPKPSLAPGGPGREQVLAAVRAEWGTYDTRHQGRLGPLEFGTWVMRANGAAVQPPGAARGQAGTKPVTTMNVTARAFARADADHDGGVTPEELTAFLLAK